MAAMMMIKSSVVAFVLVFVTLTLTNVALAEPDLVVMVSRHGVRPPFGPTGGNLTANSLKPYTNLAVPTSEADWGVDPSKGQPLTPHGSRAIAAMGDWHRQMLGEYPCDALAFYADASPRDISTAKAFLSGFVPLCSSSVNISTAHALPLFNQGNDATAACGQPPKSLIESLMGALGDDFSALNNEYATLVADINGVFKCCNDASLCNLSPGSHCSIENIPTKFVGEFWAPVSGPVPIAGYFGTFALLASLNNISMDWLGTGVDLERIVRWYQLSLDGVLDIADNYWSARSFASTLAAEILASLEQKMSGRNIAALAHSPDTKFVYLAGHDTNIVLLRHLLGGLQWTTKGWEANNPPPGSMLSFELSQKNSTWYVSLRFTAATPEQIRSAASFDDKETPGTTLVAIPGCDDLECDYATFKAVMLDAIDADCVGVPALQDWVQSGKPAPGNLIMAIVITELVIVFLVGILCIATSTWMLRGTMRHSQFRKRDNLPTYTSTEEPRESTGTADGDRAWVFFPSSLGDWIPSFESVLGYAALGGGGEEEEEEEE